MMSRTRYFADDYAIMIGALCALRYATPRCFRCRRQRDDSMLAAPLAAAVTLLRTPPLLIHAADYDDIR